jgi:hypothetical protein
VNSIEMLYLVPRVLMDILAVVDTFLVYKMAERRYNRNVAVIARECNCVFGLVVAEVNKRILHLMGIPLRKG